jgi:hypothetical protein
MRSQCVDKFSTLSGSPEGDPASTGTALLLQQQQNKPTSCSGGVDSCHDHKRVISSTQQFK